MLTITVSSDEQFDDEKQEFIYNKVELELEHSLVSLSKWEEKFEKPFLDGKEKTTEEALYYIKAMTLNGDFPLKLYEDVDDEGMRKIDAYINSKMTATWFKELPGRSNSTEVITAEVIYHWMMTQNIPLDFENRHLNKLFTIIKVASHKNAPPKKMSRSEIAQRNRELNAKRRAQMGTSG